MFKLVAAVSISRQRTTITLVFAFAPHDYDSTSFHRIRRFNREQDASFGPGTTSVSRTGSTGIPHWRNLEHWAQLLHAMQPCYKNVPWNASVGTTTMAVINSILRTAAELADVEWAKVSKVMEHQRRALIALEARWAIDK